MAWQQQAGYETREHLAATTPGVSGAFLGEATRPAINAVALQALRRELDWLVAEAPVQQRGSDLKHAMSASRRLAHLLSLIHAGVGECQKLVAASLWALG